MDPQSSRSRTRRIGRGQFEDRSRPSRPSRAPEELANPGNVVDQAASSRPIHPRHPRASMSGPDVTQSLRSQQERGPRRLVPPAPRVSDEVDRSSQISDDLDEESSPDDEFKAAFRPSMEQHWPLTAPSAPRPVESDPFVSTPPKASRVPPQRPPRPHHGLSQEDITYLEGSTPFFLPSPPRAPERQDSEPTPEQHPSRRSARYVAFPIPTPHQVEVISEIPEEPARSKRTSVMGPPPSSRRGWSTLFNTNSPHVAPIVEELASLKSRTSNASSGAMPDFIYGNSAGSEASHEEWQNGARVHDEGLATGSEQGDPHSASPVEHDQGVSLSPRHNPFITRDSFIENPSNSSITPIQEQSPELHTGMSSLNPTPDARANTFGSSCASDVEKWQEASGSPEPLNRLQSKRPPKLDLDAIKAAEERGSLTSLPDLIMRATRLAAMIESGKRPSSRHDELDFSHDRSVLQHGSQSSNANGRNSSNLSNEPSTFPPPIPPPEKTNYRTSLFLMMGGKGNKEANATAAATSTRRKKEARQCCGLPPWGLVLFILLMLSCVVVIVVVPVELLVVQKQKSSGGQIQKCEASLQCLHGGINVVLDGSCSCICTNGFSGLGCEIAGSQGCSMSNLVATDGSSRINNATLGDAVPRILSDAAGNYSIDLSASVILARFNSANLSCIAQNSLITFDRQDTRIGAADDPIKVDGVISKDEESATSYQERSFLKDLLVMRSLRRRGHDDDKKTPETTVSSRSTQNPTSSSSSASSSTFVVTEEVFDFARTAVLYVLQQESFAAATDAHDSLQSFFSQAASGLTTSSDTVTVQEASNLKISNGTSVDLVSATIDMKNSPTGQEKMPIINGVAYLAVISN